MRLRAMVWNVHGFRAGTSRMAEAVATGGPDILIVNETGFLGLRLRRFAKRLGMRRASGLHGLRRIRNAVLVRPPWRVVGQHVTGLPRSGGNRRRGIVVAEVRRAGRRLTVASIHLGLSSKERAEHARLVTDLVPRHDPAIVGGDLNEGPDGPAAAWIAGRLWDVLHGTEWTTFPAREPAARIDYLFVSEQLLPERAWVGANGFQELSDHLPVLADLSIRE